MQATVRSFAIGARLGAPDTPVAVMIGDYGIQYTINELGTAAEHKLPLVILTPIPLTFIGIMLGHWLFGAPFTATSMIGFIALAGVAFLSGMA